jgi:LmbE family N-acetylglucosaminyl deacetylase
MNNPYLHMVETYRRTVEEGRRLPLGGFAPDQPPPHPAPDAPTVLLFSPHPDDECITGALPLRLRRQAGMRIINVAVTQGSRKERQAGRWAEVSAACRYLGFECIPTVPGGLEKVNPVARETDPARWQRSVDVITGILESHRPAVVFIPHAKDANSTHVGTYLLVTEALQRLPASFVCRVVTTEFWAPMETPNLMIESSVEEVAALVAATSFHAGEVQRNPYHLTLPAWMQDNVRRGGELVGVQGGAPPAFTFATLYGVYRWAAGTLHRAYEGGRMVPSSAPLSGLFAPDSRGGE